MSVTRFRVASLALCLVLVGCGSQPIEPSESEEQGSAPPGGSSASGVGCFVGASQNSPNMCGLLPSLGSPFADQAMAIEVGLHRSFWGGIPVNDVVVMNECSPQSRNARADPLTRDILFGYHMFHTLVAEHGNVLPVAGVLGHEWGHQVQFQLGWFTNPVRNMELEADAFSGYFMALAKGWAWQFMNSYFQTVYNTGEYNFNSPGHHGTPSQRLGMARVGFDTAIEASRLGRPLHYFELHQIFYTSIARLGLTTHIEEQVLSTELERVTQRVAAGEAQRIVRGESQGTPGQVPGPASARRGLWPRR